MTEQSMVRGASRRRWLLVATLAAALCGAPFAFAALPARSAAVPPAALRARVLASARVPYQGLVETRGAIALPPLPGMADTAALLGAASRVRVWDDAPRRSRVALLAPTGERDYYQDGRGLAIWDYERALRTTVVGDPAVRLPRPGDLLPPVLARRLLGYARPGDALTALAPRRVAGRGVPGVRVVPADAGTTIAAVEVWADPADGLALEVRVLAKGARGPVLTTRFLDLDRARPDAGTVTARPAPGVATVRVETPDLISRLAARTTDPLPAALAGRRALPGTASVANVRAYQGGFSSFAVVPLPGRYGLHVLDTARAAGAAPLGVTGGEALLLRSAGLTAAIVHVPAGDRTFLVAGPVTDALAARVARELIS
ncbi:hypothetical protein [Actinomadura parmotrematis]|uniref:Transcriptional regulator n=1 Tax=Actinomadura parmotrematis TaxID=2864039 RepID=A0ABS7G1Q3_9ACTN|nr:hypothetical protein [Actinomadura parmotrematis]MBW8486637.1 hypothetical protein [Actinomadura parmotrematis]